MNPIEELLQTIERLNDYIKELKGKEKKKAINRRDELELQLRREMAY